MKPNLREGSTWRGFVRAVTAVGVAVVLWLGGDQEDVAETIATIENAEAALWTAISLLAGSEFVKGIIGIFGSEKE